MPVYTWLRCRRRQLTRLSATGDGRGDDLVDSTTDLKEDDNERPVPTMELKGEGTLGVKGLWGERTLK